MPHYGVTFNNRFTIIIFMPTHGSLTKAGKVKGQTPKVQAKEKSSSISKVRNKENYIKRFEKRIPPGQKKPERNRRR